MAGAARVRLRPAVLGRLRHRRDRAGAGHRRRRLPRVRQVGRGGHRRAAGHRGAVLSADLPRLPQRRRSVRGQPRQLRRERGAHRGRGPAGGLRDDRRRVRGRRRGGHHQRRAEPAPLRGRAVSRFHRGVDAGQPAWRPGIRAGLRHPDLHLRHAHLPDVPHRRDQGRSPGSCPTPPPPPNNCSAPPTSAGSSPCCSSCARSPPAAPR